MHINISAYAKKYRDSLERLGTVMITLIKGGHVINPAAGVDGIFDVLIEDDIIKAVEPEINTEAHQVIDASGKLVMPGFIDMHVHLREPGFEYKETIETGSMAAAVGGYTTICPMPNTKPVIDSRCMVEYLKLKSEKEAAINIIPVGSVTVGQMGEKLSDMEGMAKAGALAVSEDGKSVMDVLLYKEGMKLAKDNNLLVLAHCEDKVLVNGGVMNEGAKSRELGLPGISNSVEDVITARDILLAKETGARLHLCHCSTKDSVALVKFAKEIGADVTAEVCPHHFSMTEEEITSDDGNFKMNPPLRSKEDVEALKQGLKDGIMEVISTDHAPHGEEEKKGSMLKAPFGIVGSETAFALTYTHLVKEGWLTLTQMVEKMSCNPARILGIDKGNIAPGKTADIVIADIDEEYTIDASKFVSKGKNTPFDGHKVYGRVLMTFVSGEVVYEY